MVVNFSENLQPLVDQVQANSYTHPAVALEAARQLLKHCHTPEHIAYVYEQMGFAHLILGEHRLSCLFYEQARSLQPENMYILANLAHAQYELGDKDKAVRTGRQALKIKDQEACSKSKAEPIQPLHQGKTNLVSYSLYGSHPRYCEMAVLNVIAAKRHLPDFACRFYVDRSVPTAVLERLQRLGAQYVEMDEITPKMPPTFWRFLAMDDARADRVLVRDVDSLIDAKEAWCVKEWLASKHIFHIIRDDCCHTELILAGLFGIRSGVIRNVRSQIEEFIQSNGAAAWQRYADQLFLRHHIWPTVRKHTLTHDTIYCYGEHVKPLTYPPKPDDGPRNTFIGANHATCQIACELEPAPPSGTHAVLSIKDETQQLVCNYPLHPTPGSRQWQTHLPLSYMQALESGKWQYDISLKTDDQWQIGAGSIAPSLLG
jgi:tetratricopeptide (TPR) repeat protein